MLMIPNYNNNNNKMITVVMIIILAENIEPLYPPYVTFDDLENHSG